MQIRPISGVSEKNNQSHVEFEPSTDLTDPPAIAMGARGFEPRTFRM